MSVHPIADLLTSDIKPSWQESVALAQEVASQLAPGQPLPAAEDLLLAEDGTLTFGFAGESGQPQVTDLAELLMRLLDGTPAPGSLVDLVRENARPEPAHPTLDGFSRALAFYERPNRRADLAAVGGRLAARAQAEHARDVVAQLRQKALTESETPKPDVERKDPVQRPFSRRPILIATGGLLVVFLIVFLGGAMLVSGPLSPPAIATNPPASPAAPSTAGPTTDVDATSAPAGSSGIAAATSAPTNSSGIAVAAAVATDGRGQPDARTLRTSSRTAASVPAVRPKPPAQQPSFPAKPTALRPPPISSPRALSQGPLLQRSPGEPVVRAASNGDATAVNPLPLPAPRGAQAMRAAHVDDSGVSGGLPDDVPVYSRADPDVKPPRIVRQQLPSVPTPNAQTGYLEFVVDAQGNVEALTLISPTTRFQELMLVAAAKAWKFRPALFDGRPVKYRMRVPITLDGPP